MRTEAIRSSTPRMLNIGCGGCFHPDWVNMDISSHDGRVWSYDVRAGIPFADDTFDIVYHSHVLEHLTPEWGQRLLRECFRVLRPGGLVRVAVPDVENIARAYLHALDDAEQGDSGAQERHAWMLTELVDQLSRTRSGGAMLDWWRKNPVPQRAFICGRLGAEAEQGITAAQHMGPRAQETSLLPRDDVNFPQSGELHRWMYDRLSLRRALEEAGFIEVQRRAHNASGAPEILAYGLDGPVDSVPRKPDSLFMEARKPMQEKAETPLRAALFCTSDTGGAGIAARRLHTALRRQGVLSECYVGRQQWHTEGVHVLPLRNGGLRALSDGSAEQLACVAHGQLQARALARYPQRPRGCELFSVPDGGHLESLPFLPDFDLLHLHWVAGLCDPMFDAAALHGRPVIWTLHDMQPFTGGCHYCDGCRKFEETCGACPQLGSAEENDLSRATWKGRMSALRGMNLHIVTPSRWLAEEARKSSLFRRFPVHVIGNAHPLDVYQPLNKAAARAALNLPVDSLVLLFAAQGLSNRRKGGRYLLNMLQKLAQMPLAAHTRVLLLGGNPDAALFQCGVNVASAGHVDDDSTMAALYSAADAVLVPSLEDNQPNVICEAQACGTPVVAFACGGIPEMILHKKSGWLAPARAADGLLEGVLWAEAARHSPLTRRLCRAHALEQWNAEQRSADYAELYAQVCGKPRLKGK